ncbi:MBL fold metallo-hydrolase [Chelativorans sp. ZYF759]|uniref:MBL fold metallo-hydrolase n=1 Tax=Chelativorans sp. ZYF759 TaxID=2692213 RepID=UPI00145F7C3D|nr:MBL fold metallo-hydrolase [Chelativorans sp. ZYF759]NMG41669.1 MBL fold metallo-hydrolase [Chelativorans sp. ZYF759]
MNSRRTTGGETGRPGAQDCFNISQPAFGTVAQIAPGLLWTRLPLPMKVGHTNVYLLADADGWAIIDTGYGDARSIDTWRRLLDGPLMGQRITRVIVTHAHIDHIGAAGWLCRTLGAPLHMSQVEYLTCQIDLLDPGRYGRDEYQAFLRSHGVGSEAAVSIAGLLAAYGDGLTGLPETFVSLNAGDILELGDRRLKILLGPGHSPAQLMLHCPEEGWLISADQILGGIQPLLVLPPTEPDGNPYELFLRSMDELAGDVDPDALVLPGHYLPFFGLADRIALQREHHHSRCEIMVEACCEQPRSAAELTQSLFPGPLNHRQLNHAIGEVIPYANWLVTQRRMHWLDHNADGVRRLSCARR